MTFDIISLAIGLGLGGVIVFFALAAKLAALREKIKHFEDAQGGMGNLFSAMAQEALAKSSEQFLTLAQEKLKQAQADGSHDMEKRQKALTDMVNPLQENLKQLNQAVEQMKGTDQALRADMQLLNRETARLVGALKDPAGQGRWGEFILSGLLEKSGLIKGVHFDMQVTIEHEGGKHRPDAVIRLHDGFNIIIDSKAPINEFANRLGENLSTDETDQITAALAKQVRAHVKDLSRKGYWENIESADFTVLFLPSEHLFSMTLRADPEIVDFAASSNVIIASPTLLMSLLRVVSLGWRQAELAKNAQDISAKGAELYQRLAIFAGHFEKIGKGIGGAMNSYNEAIGSLERSILPSARKLKELHVQTGGKEVAEPAPLEISARGLSAPELMDDENDKLRLLK